MATLLAAAKLMKRSNLPADAVVNTFVFDGLTLGGSASTEMDALTVAVSAFYNGSHSHTGISGFMSAAMSAASEANEISYYRIDGHLDGSAHGAPIRTDLWTLAAPDATSLPDEVSAVVTYARAYGSDVEFGTHTRPRARDRGRVFVGCLGASAIDTDATTKECYLASAFITALAHAGADLITNSAPTGAWSQWSRVNASVAPVTNGWVDDRPDTQRRRAPLARVRSLW